MTNPLFYEINTRCWLNELSQRERRPITLSNVPEKELQQWIRFGFTHVWLMGVWTSGPQARAQALANIHLRQQYSEALPDWREEDVAGSPYAIADYRVPQGLGGEEGLRKFRARLRDSGIKLILDFVPNHLGMDHAWVGEQPELFVQSPQNREGTFLAETTAGPFHLAHGKDPYFPAWTDTVQLDYRVPATQTAMTNQLLQIAERCDGVRCDMAMLDLKDVFAKTWEQFPSATQAAGSEFWAEAVPAVKTAHPEFLFLAEVYWGLEGRLRELGFDYTYDKVLYDKIVSRDWGSIQQYLLSCGSLSGGAHFLENHDEPRVASVLSVDEHRAAALLVLTLPGMRFLHEGQLTGTRVRIPVQLARRAPPAAQAEIIQTYERLLAAAKETSVGKGRGSVLALRPAWPDNPTAQNIVVIRWQSQPGRFELAVANLAGYRSQCYVPLNGADLEGGDWSFSDLLGSERFVRDRASLETKGLYLDVPPHATQLFQCAARL